MREHITSDDGRASKRCNQLRRRPQYPGSPPPSLGDSPTRFKNRRGSFLLWGIMVVTMMAILAATIAPLLGATTSAERVHDTFAKLADIDTAINEFEATVHTGNITTNQFPGRLSELWIPLTGTEVNSCGNAMTGNAPTQWPTNGPYLAPPGWDTPLGPINEVIERTTPPSTNPLIIRIPDVPQNLVAEMDATFDDGVSTTGKIRYTPGTDDIDLTYYVTPRQNNKC